MVRRWLIGASILLSVALVAAGCGSTNNTGNSGGNAGPVQGAAGQICGNGGGDKPGYTNDIPKISGEASTLSGAGGTFVAPMLSVWTKEYSKTDKVQVAYQSIGSGGGVKQISAGTVDFGESDAPMKDSELAQAKGPILHVPLVLGAVVPTYKLTGVSSGLKFDGETLGKIFAGEITKWNDPALTALNPDAKLPDQPIAVVHRSDGSGTTAIWTDFLTKTSPSWVSKLGQVELTYALAQNLPYGFVKNKAGKFVQPCVATVEAATKGVTFPADLRTSLTDQPGADAYPVSGTTWALIYQNQTDKAKAAALVNFFAWVLSQGQDMATSVNYAPLGQDLRDKSFAQLKKITVNGQPLVSQ